MKITFFFEVPRPTSPLSQIERRLQESAYSAQPPFGYLMQHEKLSPEDSTKISYQVRVNAHASTIALVTERIIGCYLFKANKGTARFFAPDKTELAQLFCRGVKSAMKAPIRDISAMIVEANKPDPEIKCEMPFDAQPPVLLPQQARDIFLSLTGIRPKPVVRKSSSGYLLSDEDGKSYAMAWMSNGWHIADWAGAKHPRAWSSSPNSATYSVELMLSFLLSIGDDISFISETYEPRGTVIRKKFMTGFGSVNLHTRRENPGETEMLLDLPFEDKIRFYPKGINSINFGSYRSVQSLIF